MSDGLNNSQEKRESEEGSKKEGDNAEANANTVSDNNNEEEVPGERVPPVNTSFSAVINLEEDNIII